MKHLVIEAKSVEELAHLFKLLTEARERAGRLREENRKLNREIANLARDNAEATT
jgi:hypothetical protein